MAESLEFIISQSPNKSLAVTNTNSLGTVIDLATETTVTAINTALQTAGITQVQLAAAITALQKIDDMISGNEAQVDVVAALPTGTNNIGDVDVATLPSGNLGQQAKAASLSVAPATDIADATYLGDIKFGEALVAGTNVIGLIRLVSAAGHEVTDDIQDDVKTHRGKAALLNSGVKSADAAIKASAGAVYWLTVSDTAALAIEINDSANNGGTDVWALDLPAGGYAHFIFDPPIECGTGIYLDVSTATCKVTIGYI